MAGFTDDCETGVLTDKWTVDAGIANYSTDQKHSGSKGIKFGTIFFIEDAESGTPAGKWTSFLTGGTPIYVYSTEQAHSGSYSYKNSVDSGDYVLSIKNITETNLTVETWLYDPLGSSFDYIYFGIDINAANLVQIIGVHPGTSTTNYIWRHGETYAVSSVTRTLGWHKFKIVKQGTSCYFYIDDIYAGSSSDAGSTSTNVFAGQSSSASTLTNYWDDFKVYDANESTIHADFTQPDTPSFSDSWFYDNGLTGGSSPDRIRVYNSLFDSTTHRTTLGIDTETSTTKYVYKEEAGSFTATSVDRSIGWHKATFEWDGSNCKYYIDDTLVFTGTPTQTYNRISLVGINEAGDGTGYLDDINITTSEITAYSDQDVKLFIEAKGYSDQNVKLLVEVEQIDDRDIKMPIEQTDYDDQDIKLDINLPGYQDQDTKLFIEQKGYNDQDTKLFIEQTAYDEQDVKLFVELPDHNDVQIKMPVIRKLTRIYNILDRLPSWWHKDGEGQPL